MVALAVGFAVGLAVGAFEDGLAVGIVVGDCVGAAVRPPDSFFLVGLAELVLGFAVGLAVGLVLGAALGRATLKPYKPAAQSIQVLLLVAPVVLPNLPVEQC